MAGNQTQTSTQVRNLYSEGISYLNMKFFNTNFSFQFYPFTGKDQNGRSTYAKSGETTTVNYEGAFALWVAAKFIIDGQIEELDLPISCASGAELRLQRTKNQAGFYDTVFSITKNGNTIPFKFQTAQINVIENGQSVTKVVECGLGAFKMTIEGYLTGINADRHLDKLTEEYVKLQENKNGGNQNGYQKNNNYGNGGYQQQNNFKRPVNGYRKNYGNQQRNNWNNNQAPVQYANGNNYSIPNN